MYPSAAVSLKPRRGLATAILYAVVGGGDSQQQCHEEMCDRPPWLPADPSPTSHGKSIPHTAVDVPRSALLNRAFSLEVEMDPKAADFIEDAYFLDFEASLAQKQ